MQSAAQHHFHETQMSKYLVVMVTPRAGLDFFADYQMQLHFPMQQECGARDSKEVLLGSISSCGNLPKKPSALTNWLQLIHVDVQVAIHFSLPSPALWLRALQG